MNPTAGPTPITGALSLIIDVVFQIAIILVMLRFLLQLTRADFYNPVSQFVVQATQPVLRPMRRFIPGIAGIDISAILLMIVLQTLAFVLLTLVAGGQVMLVGFLIYAIAELFRLSCNVFIVAIFIQVITSWLIMFGWIPHRQTPITTLLYSFTEPLFRPVRRFLPATSGLDFSPMIVLLGLFVVKMLVGETLISLAIPFLSPA